MDQALADPGRTELLRRVVQAAGRSAIEDKVHALGRILATGLHDDGARLDEALPLAAALAELDPAHVRLLAHMADRGMYTDHPAQLGDRPRLGLHRLGEALPGGELVATSVMRTLERHGLADDPNPGVMDGGDMSITDPDHIGLGTRSRRLAAAVWTCSAAMRNGVTVAPRPTSAGGTERTRQAADAHRGAGASTSWPVIVSGTSLPQGH